MRGSMSMQAKNIASSRGRAFSTATHETRGTSEGTNDAEAFEPIYDNLPSQLYSLEESVYQASRTLKLLQPGEAIIAFGDFAGEVKVPLLPTADLSEEDNGALRRASSMHHRRRFRSKKRRPRWLHGKRISLH